MKKTFAALFALLMVLSCVTVATAAKTGFSDVAEDRWSAASIKYAVDNGYMKGVGGDKFDPEGSLTRAMVATVLWRREGEPKPTAPSGFSDVPANEWYTDAVAWAKETGVVKGITATTFEPDGLITREQLATMLFRFSSSAPVSVPERADLTPFSDDEKVSGWANEPLGWAVEAGLIKGTDGNRLAPEGDATREQFAAIIERYDGSFALKYNAPVVRSHYTEKEYPLVDDADFYVSTTGSDDNDGSFEHPFRTWERARDAVRTLDKTGRDGITVAFFAGDYGPLSVTLSAEDSGTPERPVTYCKYGDGDVTFDNGVTVGADEFSPIGEDEYGLFPDKAVSKIKKADVTGLVAGDPDDLVIFTDDGILIEARYPNRYPDGTDQLVTMGAAAASRDSYRLTSRILTNRIAKYHTVRGMKVYGYIVRGYQKHTIKVSSYDPEEQIIRLLNPEAGDYYGAINPDKDDCDMAFLNISEELDAAGEYWLDSETMTLYVYDPHGTLRIPVYGTMITMDHASDVAFRGLTFLNSRERFIDEKLGHGITVERCRFSVAAANEGLMFRDSEIGVPKDVRFASSEFENFYGAAVKIEGGCEGEHRFDKETRAVFDNNLVRATNLVYDAYNGVDMRNCSNLTFSHNRFERCSRGAISFSRSYDVLVEYNDFDSVMCNSTDGGILYADWSADGRNLVVRYNFFGSATTEGIGKYGFYVDDWTCGAEVYSNLFYNTGNCNVMVHDGRDCSIHDNVSVTTQAHGGSFSVIGARADLEENAGDIIWEEGRDSVWSDYPHDIVWKAESVWSEFFHNAESYENYRNAILERWPEILEYHINFNDRDDPKYIFNSVNDVRDNVFINKDAEAYSVSDREIVRRYTATEGQVGYYLTENPLFVNPSRGDYRVKDGVDFPDIHFEKIGRY